jgi:hypothetical protein
MMHIKDVNPMLLNFLLFPFSLRGKAKEWLISLPLKTITSWKKCCNMFMTKIFQLTKTMQLRFNITDFRQEDREPLALAWDRMKEFVRNCPNHVMKEWLILHIFYHACNSMSKSMLGTAAGEHSW